MSITITADSKNTLSITGESKPSSETWASTDPETWGDQDGTWGEHGLAIVKESKNNLNISNEAKP